MKSSKEWDTTILIDVELQSITVTLPIKRREYYSVLRVLTDFDHPRPVFPPVLVKDFGHYRRPSGKWVFEQSARFLSAPGHMHAGCLVTAFGDVHMGSQPCASFWSSL